MTSRSFSGHVRGAAFLLAVGLLSACSDSSAPSMVPAVPVQPPPAAPPQAAPPQAPVAAPEPETPTEQRVRPDADACLAFCNQLEFCIPPQLRKLERVKMSFPPDCALGCLDLPVDALRCALGQRCEELAAGNCGPEVGGLVRKISGA